MNTTASSVDWKLEFISQRSKTTFLSWIEQVQQGIAATAAPTATPQERCQSLSELKQSLLAIRDRIIGNSCCKYFFVRHGLLQALTPLLWLRDESSAEFVRLLRECQREALTLLSVLIAQSGEGLSFPVGESDGLFGNLLGLLKADTDPKFLEILTRSLCNYARKVPAARGALFEATTLPVLLSFLSEGRSSSAVVQNICALLAAGCDAEARSRLLLSERVLPQVLSRLTGSV